MNDFYKDFEKIEIDNMIALIFIILSIINIIGDEEKKKYIKTNDERYNQNANRLFVLVQLVTTIVCVFFVYRNYNNLKNENSSINEIRLIGSILIFVGSLLILITQTNDNSINNFPII